jgi:hypothetical protein
MSTAETHLHFQRSTAEAQSKARTNSSDSKEEEERMTSTLGKKTLTNLYEDKVLQLNEQSASYGKVKAALKSRPENLRENLESAIADVRKHDRELASTDEKIYNGEKLSGGIQFQKTPVVKSFDKWKDLYGGPSAGDSQELGESGELGSTRRRGMNSSKMLTMKASNELVRIKEKACKIPTTHFRKAPELTNMDQWRERYGVVGDGRK